MLGEIDKSLKPVKSKLFLCKPDRTTIAELTEAKDKKLSIKSNGIHGLTFSLPYKIEKNRKFIRNDHVDLLRGHFLIRYEKNNMTEYFIITKPSKSADDTDSMLVECNLLPYQLGKKYIRNYSETKQLFDETGSNGILNDTLLTKTDWSIGHIDVDISLKVRTFDISEKSLLEFITTDIAEAFDCIVQWNTVDKQVSFYKESSLGINRGLSIEYGKYLKSINQEPDFDNVITRLYPYGKDGLSIRRLNASGSDFIEDFSYYLHPFQRDSEGNVLQHSNYMGDDLSHAILDYNELLEIKNGEFENLFNDESDLQQSLITKRNERTALITELETIQDRIDIANSKNEPYSNSTAYNVGDYVIFNGTPYLCIQNTTAGTSPNNEDFWDNLLANESNKNSEIDTKQSEIDIIQSDIETINSQMLSLQNEIAIENNFTAEQISQRNDFTHERYWQNNSYFDDEELFKEGKIRLNRVKQPLISYNIDIVDFLNVVECQRDWEKLNQFDIITVKYPNFNVDIEAKIINIDHEEDSNNLNIEIANANDIKNGFIEMKDMLQQGVSSSTTQDMSKFKWDKSISNENEINNIINNKWDSAKREIESGVNQTVTINRRGITLTDNDDAQKFLRMTNGVIGITDNGGNDFKLAIDGSGVYAERLFGKIIAGVNLSIENDAGKFTFDSNGVVIDGSSLEITGGIGNTNISDGSISVSKLGSTVIEGGKITTGLVDASRIDTGELNAARISANSITATKLNITTLSSITANLGTINAGTINADNVNVTNLNGSEVNRGTIDGNNVVVDNLNATNINTGTLTGRTIRTSASGTRVVLNSNFADTYWYSGSNLLFQVYDELTRCSLGSSVALPVFPLGDWNFSEANVSGISATATFG